MLFKGFFCPEGSITPVPCPPGTFRSEGAALISRSCLTCPVDFFNPIPGQKACLPCGSEAVQPAEGQETCICLGKGQVFQVQEQSRKSRSVLTHLSIISHFVLHSLCFTCTALFSLTPFSIDSLQSYTSFPITQTHREGDGDTGSTYVLSFFRATSILPLCWKVKGMCMDIKVSSDLGQIRCNA